MDYTDDYLTRLGAKLDALELSEGEHAALRSIFDAAMPDEDVAGYQHRPPATGLEIEQTATYGVRIGLLNLSSVGYGEGIRPTGQEN